MFIYCQELLKIPSFKDIELVAGEEGLDRKVSWVYVLQTQSLEDWVNGGELVFVVSSENLYEILEEAVHNKIAGVVVLKNKNNESVIGSEMIDYANKEKLPLFQMDYRKKIIDVTRDISTYIIHKQEKVDYLNYFFNSVLFSENLKKNDIDDFKLNFEITSEHVFFISTIHCMDESKLSNIETLLHMYVDDTDANIITFNINSRLVIFTYALSNHVARAKKLLKSSFLVLNEKFPDSIFLGIGSHCTNFHDIRYSYMKSIKSIDLCNLEIRVVDYEELGFERLLLTTIEAEELEEYAEFVLGDVKEHDEKHNTYFMDTIKEYVLCNGNINKASAQMFVHRNTCVYRIAKIHELFQIDLDDPYVRADILNCLSIYRFLDPLE